MRGENGRGVPSSLAPSPEAVFGEVDGDPRFDACAVNRLGAQLAACTGFVWDQRNAGPGFEQWGVPPIESEQVFFQRPILIAADARGFEGEARFAALGRTTADRRLSVIFTIRGTLIRVISARDRSGRERRIHEGA